MIRYYFKVDCTIDDNKEIFYHGDVKDEREVSYQIKSCSHQNFNISFADFKKKVVEYFEDRFQAKGKVFADIGYGEVKVRVYQIEDFVEIDRRLTALENRNNERY